MTTITPSEAGRRAARIGHENGAIIPSAETRAAECHESGNDVTAAYWWAYAAEVRRLTHGTLRSCPRCGWETIAARCPHCGTDVDSTGKDPAA